MCVRDSSQNVRPIAHPHTATAADVTAPGVDLAESDPALRARLDDRLRDVTDITRRGIDGELSTFCTGAEGRARSGGPTATPITLSAAPRVRRIGHFRPRRFRRSTVRRR